MNWQSWLIIGVIAALFIGVVVGWIYNRKKGKGSCSCGCSCGGCAMNGTCHSDKK